MTIGKWYPKSSLLKRIQIYLKYRFGKYSRQMSLDCYLYYGFDHISKQQISEILFDDEVEYYEKLFNDDEYRHIFNSKKEFYRRFARYIHRDIFDPAKSSYEEYLEFIDKHPRIAVKADKLYGGMGFFVIDYGKNNENTNPRRDYEGLKNGDVIAEEYVYNAQSYKKIYDKSLNTVRITTLIDINGKPQVIAAVNQFGSHGSITDNDEYDGIWAGCDTITGEIYCAEKNDVTAIYYDVHPDTGEKIIGFANSQWESIITLAKNAAKEVPECRLIGWDIAVLEDNTIELIEGNVTPELGIWQAMTHSGLRTLFTNQARDMIK